MGSWVVSFQVDVTALGDLIDKLRENQSAIGDGLEAGMTSAMAKLAAYIQQNKLSGQVLNQRSGKLSQSVGHPTVSRESDTRVVGAIGGVFYGKVQEFGATITINSAVNMKGIGWRYLKTITLPARPWLNPSIEEQLDMISAEVVGAVKEALQ